MCVLLSHSDQKKNCIAQNCRDFYCVSSKCDDLKILDKKQQFDHWVDVFFSFKSNPCKSS